jgi:acyl-coenzyme A synthetase/AMP-(fatty) acid ligase
LLASAEAMLRARPAAAFALLNHILKVPRIWRFVDQFPQTASGKIQKFALREAYLGART